MKLTELVHVVGDSGMHRNVSDAIENMTHHSKTHKNEDMRKVCSDAVRSLNRHIQQPQGLYDDPHSFVKIIQAFKGDPDKNRIKHATDALGSYTQSDSD